MDCAVVRTKVTILSEASMEQIVLELAVLGESSKEKIYKFLSNIKEREAIQKTFSQEELVLALTLMLKRLMNPNSLQEELAG